MSLFRRKRKEAFYYPFVEIKRIQVDRYRYLDEATRSVLMTARGRISFIMCVLGVLFFIILGRLFYLTVMNYQGRTFAPSTLKTDIDLRRQNIVDRNGFVLATSLPTVDLSVNPRLVKNPEEVAKRLSAVLPDVSYQEVLEKLTDDASFRYIKRNLTPKERQDINWLGYYFLNETQGEKRVYPHSHLFSHILGGVDIDNRGIAGLEKSYEKELSETELQLSLDMSVQETVRRALEKGMTKHQATGGLGIVMDVRNAEVLALVSLPDYNPNLPAGEDLSVRFNKATAGIYEFGSVFKLFNTALGLESGVIRPTDLFDASENVKIGRKVITDYQGQNRSLTVPEILIHSSNIGSVKIAKEIGFQKQRDFMQQLGFFDRLPIQLPERAMPQYPTGEKWADITLANVAFGYGISVSPLHLIAAVAALVNGGYYRVPTFIKNGNQHEPERLVLSPKTSDIMRHMMWAVINWDIKPTDMMSVYAVGGKTGSANLIQDGKYVQGMLRTSFVGVFPMAAPRYAVLVTLENPKRLKENWYFNTAGWNAKPVGREIITQIAPYLGVAPQEIGKQPTYITRAIEASQEYKKKKKR